MSRSLRPLGRLCAVALLIATVAGIQSSAAAGGRGHSIGGHGHPSVWHWWGFGVGGAPRADFTVQAPAAHGLVPGMTRSLQLTVRNPHPYPIRITDIGATLTATSRRGCKAVASNLTVRPHQGQPALPMVIPARTTRAAGRIPLYVPNTVVNECQRARFIITFHGKAEKVGRDR